MNNYLIWDNKFIDTNDIVQICLLYDQGYLYNRIEKGGMYRSRSLRIDLSKFEYNSENRRIIEKTKGLEVNPVKLPLLDYDWHIHKMGKDFYSTKFPDIKFTALKIKNLITNVSNFNLLLKYTYQNEVIGYCICYENSSILHYSYPFYDLLYNNNNFGMGMMLKAIEYSLTYHKQYIYLGTVSRPTDVYKLQFKGLEWFNGSEWVKDIDKLKELVK